MIGRFAGFAVAATFAVTGGWSLPEFCWSTWLAGLVFAWTCVGTGAIQALATAWVRQPRYEAALPFPARIPPAAFPLLVLPLVVALAVVAFHAYAFLFGFYGLFLSFFAEMRPYDLLGRNGFINSDFYTPVTYLLVHYWPMVAGTLLANADTLVRGDPWKRMLVPTGAEVVRIHVMVVLMPFIALGAWALFGDRYHTVTIVALMGVFYFLPTPGQAPGGDPAPAPAAAGSGG
jgi:hypothetical protein